MILSFHLNILERESQLILTYIFFEGGETIGHIGFVLNVGHGDLSLTFFQVANSDSIFLSRLLLDLDPFKLKRAAHIGSPMYTPFGSIMMCAMPIQKSTQKCVHLSSCLVTSVQQPEINLV